MCVRRSMEHEDLVDKSLSLEDVDSRRLLSSDVWNKWESLFHTDFNECESFESIELSSFFLRL